MSGLTVVGQPFKVACKNGSKAKGYSRATHVVAKCNLCHNHTVVIRATLKQAKSCGCSHIKHGKDGTSIHTVWRQMMARCCDTANKSFSNYGGRGIKVCDRWKNFTAFYADMGDRPRGKTLERIDNDGDYEPLNCRWATMREQSRNKRTNRVVEIDGVSMCVTDWASHQGVSVQTVFWRLYNGWSDREAIYGKDKCRQ